MDPLPQDHGDAAPSAPQPLAPRGLLDLPDDVLEIIIRNCQEDWRRPYLEVFAACRRLRDVGYRSVRRLVFERYAWELMDSRSDGGRVVQEARFRRSCLGFLSHTRHVHEVALLPCMLFDHDTNTAAHQDTISAITAMARSILSALSSSSLTSLKASGLAVVALANADVCVASLRRLHLYHVGGWGMAEAVPAVIAQYGRGLRELSIGATDRDYEMYEGHIAPWIDASGGMSQLRHLIVAMCIDDAAASAIARCCPSLTTLTCGGMMLPAAGDALRYPKAVPELKVLKWICVWDDEYGDFVEELRSLLAGRSLDELILPSGLLESDQQLPRLAAALAQLAELPEDIDLMMRGSMDDRLLGLLYGDPARVGKVRIVASSIGPGTTSAGLQRLGSLPCLKDLSLRLVNTYDWLPLHLDEWPVGGLERLRVYFRLAEHPELSGLMAAQMMQGLAASGSRSTLRSLEVHGVELTEAVFAEPLAGLTALRALKIPVYPRPTVGPGAFERTAEWVARRIPSVMVSDKWKVG